VIPGDPGRAYALIIFDCDGVLVDSERISVRVGVSIMADLGWHLTEREYAERFVGCSTEHFTREVAKGLGRALAPDWDAPYADRFREAFDADLVPVPGVAGVLDELDQSGLPYCVASNSSRPYLHTVLTQVGFADRFAGRVFSADDVDRGKPAPDLFLHVAAQLGASPSRCAVVEDSPFGVAAASAAGMACFAFAGGVTPEERLDGHGATVVHDMADLVPLLTGTTAATGSDNDFGLFRRIG
jgi:HAD superfamily hydrolase (TIGR01509 family)